MMSPEERRAMEKMTAKATTTAEETTSAKDTTTAMEKILDEEFPLPPSDGVRSSGVNTLILSKFLADCILKHVLTEFSQPH